LKPGLFLSVLLQQFQVTVFFSGGNDHLIKVWDYNEGEVTHVGVGHSGNITRIRVSPGNQYIISVSADGAILRWKYPFAS
jgi:WD40 repeat protein